jgi:hypothetical protein
MEDAKGNCSDNLDIPASTYRQLKQQATRQHRSVRDLMLEGIEQVLLRPEPVPRARVRFPLIGSSGPKVEFD